MRYAAAFLAICLAATCLLPSPVRAATLAQWQDDIDALVGTLETVHPGAFTRESHQGFLAKTQALKRRLPGLNEEQRMVETMRLVALIGDGHTQLMPNRPDFSAWYPVRLYQFIDGYFFTTAWRSNPELAGAQLLTVAGKPVEEVVDQVRSLMNNENVLDRAEHLAPFHNAKLMLGLGYAKADGSLEISARLKDGRIVREILVPHRADDPARRKGDATMNWRFSPELFGPPFGSPSDWMTAWHGLPAAAFRSQDTSRPPHLAYRGPYAAFPIPGRDAYYIQINNVGDRGAKPFEKFFRDALAEIDRQKPKSLILDIRYCPGGDGSKVPGMIHQFIKREDQPPWKHLYVLTGRKTFSACTMVLAAFVDHVPISIVGEPAGEPLDAYGDPTTVDFDKAGMELAVSTLWHQLEDAGARYPMMPVDVPKSFSFEDYSSGKDPALDAILDGEDMRSIPLIAWDDGGAKARQIFDQRQKHYAAQAGWMNLREYDLRKSFFRLMDAGRKTDALEVARIMVESYPKSALAWSKLGQAQIAQGAEAEGLASYRRALALDPSNLDNVEQRAALASAH